MEPLFGLKPEVANTILTVIASIVASVIGGWMGARATRQTTKQTLQEAANRDEAARQATLRGVLLGIRAEFEVLREIADQEEHIGEDLAAAIEKGEGLHVIYPIQERYFVVYESNASLIGQAPEELRVAIVKTYLYTASLMNALRHNNELELECRRIESNPAEAPRGAFYRQSENMAHYARTLQTAYDMATTSLDHLFAAMDQCGLLKEPAQTLPAKPNI